MNWGWGGGWGSIPRLEILFKNGFYLFIILLRIPIGGGYVLFPPSLPPNKNPESDRN